MKDMEEQIKQRQNEIYAKERVIQERETDLMLAKNDIDRAKALAVDRQNTLDAYRMQLDESYLKAKSFQE